MTASSFLCVHGASEQTCHSDTCMCISYEATGVHVCLHSSLFIDSCLYYLWFSPLITSLPRARACAAGVQCSAVSLFVCYPVRVHAQQGYSVLLSVCLFACLKVCLSGLLWAVCMFEERSRVRLNPDR